MKTKKRYFNPVLQYYIVRAEYIMRTLKNWKGIIKIIAKMIKYGGSAI